MSDNPSPRRFADLTLTEYLDAVGAANAAPGGGSVAALAGALAAALAAMVAGLTAGRERYANHEVEMRGVLAEAGVLRRHLITLMDADTVAYTAVMDAYKLPKTDEAQGAERADAIQAALRRAAETPLATAAACTQVLRLAARSAAHGNRNAASDAAVSALLAHAGLVGAVRNVRVNLRAIHDEAFCADAVARTSALLAQGEEALAEALACADAGG
jgi:formiminotetrahydrofolate cyclodeaminase